MELEEHWDTDNEYEDNESNALLLAGGGARLDAAGPATSTASSGRAIAAEAAAATADASLGPVAGGDSNGPQQPVGRLTGFDRPHGSFAATAAAAAAAVFDSPYPSSRRLPGSAGEVDRHTGSGGGGGGDAGGGVAAEAPSTDNFAGDGATASERSLDVERAGMAMLMENFGGRSSDGGGAGSGVVDRIRPRFRHGSGGGGGGGVGRGGSLLGGVSLGDQGRAATAAAAAAAASSRIEREGGSRSRSGERSRNDPAGRRGVRDRDGGRGGRLEEGREGSLASVSLERPDFRDGEGAGSSSTESSDSEGMPPLSAGTAEEAAGTAAATVVEVTPPEEVMRALSSSHNTIALLLLLMLHFVVTRILSIAVFVVLTAIIVGLDQRFHAHADAEFLKSRFVLVGVATTAVLVVALSAMCFNEFSAGEGLLRGLILISPKPDLATVSAVIRTTVVVDLWARLLSVTVKAVLALTCGPRGGGGGVDGSTRGGTNSACAGLVCPRARYHCLRRFPGVMRRRRGDESRAGGETRNRNSPPASRSGESSGGGADHSSGDGGGSDGGSRLHAGARRAWRAWLCCSERFCGGPYRWGGRDRYGRVAMRESIDGWHPGSASEGAGDSDASGERVEGMGDWGGGGGGVARGGAGLLSRASRQRRVSAVVEMGFMVYRCVLPVPVWLGFYSKDSDYFAAVYLVLKGMEFSFRTDRLVRAVCYVRRGELDRGKFATTEEVVEAGSPDCSICYDQMDRPLLLPCDHLFCGECVAEWLERERTCPLCRAEVPTTNPIPKPLRDGRTAIVPQML